MVSEIVLKVKFSCLANSSYFKALLEMITEMKEQRHQVREEAERIRKGEKEETNRRFQEAERIRKEEKEEAERKIQEAREEAERKSKRRISSTS